MTKTNVKKHSRKGTKGVKAHSRAVPSGKSVPHDKPEYKYPQEGRYGDGHYRGYIFAPEISEDGEITGYYINREHSSTLKHLKYLNHKF